jgi:type II secretory pathway pseudopilin PulG
VVLAIMGIMAALVVPALKNFGHADAMIAATQQMLNDVARARQLAISQRTTVYMVFVPADFWNNINSSIPGGVSSLTPLQQTAVTNLCDKQLTGYTFVAYGAVGDQPGEHQWHYLAQWQQLPDNTFIDTNKFAVPGVAVSSSSLAFAPAVYSLWNQAYPHSDQNTIYPFATNATAFPTEDAPLVSMPCLAFNYLGQLTSDGQTLASRHEYIPLARGVVAPATDSTNKLFQLNPPQIAENPPGNSAVTYNIIDIDPLTGRATLEAPKLR